MTDDERVALALSALAEVVEPEAIGPLVDASIPAPGVIDLRFATTQAGYPGWFWTVSTSALADVEPTVIELQLLPGEGALVAPPWVAWEERLAEWRRAHPGDAADEDDADQDDDDEDDADDVDADADDEALDDEVLDDDVDLDGADVDGPEPGGAGDADADGDDAGDGDPDDAGDAEVDASDQAVPSARRGRRRGRRP